jgi:hypothetical protein
MHYLTHHPDRRNFGESQASVKEIKVWLLVITSGVCQTQYGQDAISFTGNRCGLLLKKTGNRGEFCRIGVYEESFPLEASSETFPETCDRCRKNSGATNMEANVI